MKIKDCKFAKKSNFDLICTLSNKINLCNKDKCPLDNTTFEKELENLINKYSKENDSNTPDFILAKYLINCLNNFNEITKERNDWYGN